MGVCYDVVGEVYDGDQAALNGVNEEWIGTNELHLLSLFVIRGDVRYVDETEVSCSH